MGRYLIVANQTLGGAELEDRIRDRIEHGEARFFVVVPMIEPERETTEWMPYDPSFGMPAVPVPQEATEGAVEEARERSRRRLDIMLEKIDSLGGQAQGEVGDPDPVRAVETALDRELFDEVIVSTLPAGLSRWIRMDLPSRIERMVDCPVTTVEAER